jgi:ATP-dependent Zn protease
MPKWKSIACSKAPTAIIQAQRTNTEKLAKALLERETLDRSEVLKSLELQQPKTPKPAAA